MFGKHIASWSKVGVCKSVRCFMEPFHYLSSNLIICFMALRAAYSKTVFKFNFKARTSRGLMRDKVSWFIRVWHEDKPDVVGIGECGPLPGLSTDDRPDFESVLQDVVVRLNTRTSMEWEEVNHFVPNNYSSIVFGLETALLDLQHGGKRVLFVNEFLTGKPIPINGLIWMGDLDFMMDQINKKVAQGFRCIKLKVGGLDFDKECDVLNYLRKRYFRENIEIRLDANGAFKPDEALYKLNELARFNVQSIEQPLRAGSEFLEELCRKSPIPVALDEELIGIRANDRAALLQRVKPHYIILKPTLHGGLSGCQNWISIAQSLHIGWWITSALESNIGLNAICQFTSEYDITIPQGLGTGGIYENNITSPLVVEKGYIQYSNQLAWESL